MFDGSLCLAQSVADSFPASLYQRWIVRQAVTVHIPLIRSDTIPVCDWFWSFCCLAFKFLSSWTPRLFWAYSLCVHHYSCLNYGTTAVTLIVLAAQNLRVVFVYKGQGINSLPFCFGNNLFRRGTLQMGELTGNNGFFWDKGGWTISGWSHSMGGSLIRETPTVLFGLKPCGALCSCSHLWWQTIGHNEENFYVSSTYLRTQRSKGLRHSCRCSLRYRCTWAFRWHRLRLNIWSTRHHSSFQPDLSTHWDDKDQFIFFICWFQIFAFRKEQKACMYHSVNLDLTVLQTSFLGKGSLSLSLSLFSSLSLSLSLSSRSKYVSICSSWNCTMYFYVCILRKRITFPFPKREDLMFSSDENKLPPKPLAFSSHLKTKRMCWSSKRTLETTRSRRHKKQECWEA